MFTLTFLMLIVGLVAMVVPLIFSGGAGLDPLAMLSNIPPNTSLFDILDAPVIGPIINTITGGVGDLIGGGTTDPSNLIALLQSILLNTLILPVVINFIILVVTMMIGGFIGRLLFPVQD
jgi:hypothetical protein